MPAISTTRAALKDAINPILRCYDYAPANLNVPCVVVGFPTRYLPNDTFGDTASFTIPISVFVSYGATRSAEDKLESYLASSGDDSIIAAIDGIGGFYQVAQVRDFNILENSAGQAFALGCVIEVEVFA